MNTFLHHFLHLLLEGGTSLLIGLLVGAAFEVFFPKAWTERWLARGPGSIFFATMAGALLPGCAMSSVPIARSLRNKGASLGTVTAFLLIAPLISPHTIAMTGAMVGLGFALLRVALPVVFTLGFGTLVDAFGRGRQAPSPCSDVSTTSTGGRGRAGEGHACGCGDKDGGEHGCGCSTTGEREGGDEAAASGGHACGCAEGEASTTGAPGASCCGGGMETRAVVEKPANEGGCRSCGGDEAGAEGRPVLARLWLHFFENARALLPVFLISLAVAAVVTSFIPASDLARHGNTWLAYLAASLAGIPLYVCDGGDVPLTRALLDMGLGAGPAFTFMLASAGTCIPTMGMAPGIIGRRLTVLYVVSVLLLAVLGGLLVEAWPLFQPPS